MKNIFSLMTIKYKMVHACLMMVYYIIKSLKG